MIKNMLVAFAILACVPAAQVYAQDYGAPATPRGNFRTDRKADTSHGKTKAAAALFPQATRAEPEQKGSAELQKQMTVLFDLQDKEGSEDQRIAKADAILANPKANAFDKSTAGYIAGYAWLSKDTDSYANAIRYIRGAIDANGLSNNTHFQMMLQLSQMLENEDKHADALTFVQRYLDETKSEDPNAYGLKARILLGAGKPGEAASSLEAMLAKKPNDKQVMLNLAGVYQEMGQDAKAGAMFDKMHAAGLLTESKDYKLGFHLLANIDGREKDALALVEEGLKKGVLEPDYDVYSFQGRVAYEADDTAGALLAWNKAAPLSKDGEMYLNVAKLQMGDEHWAEAKAAAQSAMAKGVKRKGDVYMVLARSEQGMGNKAAAKAATQEAAKYPETKKWAESALRQYSGK